MGCGSSVKASQTSTVFVQVLPSTSTQCIELAPDEDSDKEQDEVPPQALRVRELSDLMVGEAPADHLFLKQSSHKPASTWIKRVEREWRMLARGLPDAIHLHLYEDRMELMRACIEGPKNTPYADALLFFDIFLAPAFPHVPPEVTFWAHNTRINPNLYANGKICLSLLGTWAGSQVETWRPSQSSILQVLVSILGLVLVEDPFYNEPGHEALKGRPETAHQSRRYNEQVRLLVLRSMVKAPPSGFGDLAKSHYAAEGPLIAERAQRLAYGRPEERASRIDGIDFALGSPEMPPDVFKKELAKILPTLRDAWGLPEPELDSPHSDAPKSLPALPCGRKLGWIARCGVIDRTLGGG